MKKLVAGTFHAAGFFFSFKKFFDIRFFREGNDGNNRQGKAG